MTHAHACPSCTAPWSHDLPCPWLVERTEGAAATSVVSVALLCATCQAQATYAVSIRAHRRSVIAAALARSGGNASMAARALRLNRTYLARLRALEKGPDP